MASRLGTYSRFVALAKVGLPLIAIGLLSTLFLFSQRIDPEGALPFAEVDIEQMAREQQVSSPSYSGVTKDGTRLQVSAATARPDLENPSRTNASDLQAQLDFSNGISADVRAQSGVLDNAASLASLHGDVRIETSDGYNIRANQMTTELERTEITAQGDVQADSPMGTIRAQEMQITGSTDTDHVLVFKRGVKLVYQPGN